MNWYSWIGKPHVVGADPSREEGCDCLVMVTRIREWMKLPAPSPEKLNELIALARVQDVEGIKSSIEDHLSALNQPIEGAFTLLESPDQIGTAVVVEGGLLSVNHKYGVRWTATRFIRKLNWYHWQ